MTRKSKKQFKNQSQSGRSMVEMLGVLAIIAILSIGGIVGYKLAMNYYQADQIANEINLMRNDLKVKYALGNEELLLGDPYDDTPENEHYSGHLSTQYDRYPVDYDCIRKDKAEFYNCRETDAYYIKVGNVSKGVCKPLTTLVSAMDGRLEMDINGTPYIEDDLCSSDENNEIYIEFDAEEVNGNYDSNRPEGWCAKDDDCDASRPVCDVANHECVECIDYTDCKDLSKPRCNDELGNCESCPPEKPLWVDNECKACPEDQPWNGESCGCRDNGLCFTAFGNGYYCHKTKKTNLIDGETGACKKIDLPLYKKLSDGVEVWASTANIVNYWNTCRLCEARAGKDGSECSRNDYSSPNMVDLDFFQCANKEQIKQAFSSNTQFYCHKTSADTTVYDENNVAPRVLEIEEMIHLMSPWLTDVSPHLDKTLWLSFNKGHWNGVIQCCHYGHEEGGDHYPLCVGE